MKTVISFWFFSPHHTDHTVLDRWLKYDTCAAVIAFEMHWADGKDIYSLCVRASVSDNIYRRASLPHPSFFVGFLFKSKKNSLQALNRVLKMASSEEECFVLLQGCTFRVWTWGKMRKSPWKLNLGGAKISTGWDWILALPFKIVMICHYC